ncbi:hypothetical protein [Corynebacterium antarcticum]|uniref:hypothetical protein n=1 Tax=Corynebacterium antarcticum TaxID=2800405 RepID=UPI002260E800|nr:hypothetical protein [Corynebacterium antarcticum]MCX7540331.1 hypothetical protein [Corynebacterium antarcticum]
MSDRRPEDAGVGGGQDDNLFRTDAFLNDLANGVDPSGGNDELAGLLLGLKAEVDAPMPPAPSLDQLDRVDASPATTRFAPVTGPAAEKTAVGGGARVLSLTGRRRAVPGFVHGLIGAAAATLVIAGGGTAVYNAEPGSALWDVNTAMFGDHASVVELASTLEEADNRNANGDVAGALELLEQAKVMAKEINTRNAAKADPARHTTVPLTVTVTVTPEQQAPPEPATVTVTATVEGSASTTDDTLPGAVPGIPSPPSGIPPSTYPLPVPDGVDDTTRPPSPDGGAGATADNVGEVVDPVSAGTPTRGADPFPGQ